MWVLINPMWWIQVEPSDGFRVNHMMDDGSWWIQVVNPGGHIYKAISLATTFLVRVSA